MRERGFRITLSTAAMAVIAGLSMNSVAGQFDEIVADVPTRVVSFKRADLVTEKGRAAVERKIRVAAEVVCGSTDHRRVGTLHAVARNRACYERAVDEAMVQLGADALASID